MAILVISQKYSSSNRNFEISKLWNIPSHFQFNVNASNGIFSVLTMLPAKEKQSMLVKRTFSIDYNHYLSENGKTINVQSKVYKQKKKSKMKK